jgi:prophage regulatory protein
MSGTIHFLSVNTLATRFDVTKATIWRWSSHGDFPSPIKIYGSTRWTRDSILEWESQFKPSAGKTR